jgi:hypothetical protein
MIFVFKLIEMRKRDRHSELDKEFISNDEYRAKLEVLEERIRVLERIVTDDRDGLRRKFADLEDR